MDSIKDLLAREPAAGGHPLKLEVTIAQLEAFKEDPIFQIEIAAHAGGRRVDRRIAVRLEDGSPDAMWEALAATVLEVAADHVKVIDTAAAAEEEAARRNAEAREAAAAKAAADEEAARAAAAVEPVEPEGEPLEEAEER